LHNSSWIASFFIPADTPIIYRIFTYKIVRCVEMIWYGMIVLVGVAAAVSGRLYLENLGLKRAVDKQNGILKKNLAELRDEYARLNRAMKNDKNGKKD